MKLSTCFYKLLRIPIAGIALEIESMRSAPDFREGTLKHSSAPNVVPADDVLQIIRLISHAEPLELIMERIADTIASRFSIDKFTICVLDDTTGYFTPVVVRGFPEDQTRAIKRHAYTLASKTEELDDESLVAEDCHYVKGERRTNISSDDFDYVQDISRLSEPRASEDEWHELDFIDFSMKDRLGNLIGWVEIDEPHERRAPSRHDIAEIQMLSGLLGIAIENSKTSEDAIEALSESRRYLDLIVHDIGGVVEPLASRLQAMSERERTTPEDMADVMTAMKLIGEAKSLVDNVKKISLVRSGEIVETCVYDLRKVLVKCISNAKKDHPTKDVVVGLDCPYEVCNVVADDLIYDMFSFMLSDAVRRSADETAEIDIVISNGHSAWNVSIECCGTDTSSTSANGYAKDDGSGRPRQTGNEELMSTFLRLLVSRYNGLMTTSPDGAGRTVGLARYEIALPKAKVEEPADMEQYGANGNGFLAK